jgi:signal peptidase I
VKRVATVDPLTVVGDNRDASTDSRVFGALDRRDVVGRVVYRYLPEGRRGRL